MKGTRDAGQPDAPTIATERAAWFARFLRAVAAEARTGREFTCYDVARRHNLPEPPNPHLWGSAMGIAHRQGMVATVAATPSARPRTARSLVRVWVGAKQPAGGDAG